MSENDKALMEQFAEVLILLHRYRHHEQRDRGPFSDASRGQGRVLALLNMQPEMSQKNLAYLLGIRNQSLSELLTKLEKAGYITRKKSESDRRVMNISLTEEGKKVAEETANQKGFDDVFDCLTEEEQQNLSTYLDRLSDELYNRLGTEDGVRGIWGRERGDFFAAALEHFRSKGTPFSEGSTNRQEH